MSKIELFHHKVPDEERHDDVYRQVVERKSYIKVSDDKLSFVTCAKITAVARQGHRYYRWERPTFQTVRRTKNGKFVVLMGGGEARGGAKRVSIHPVPISDTIDRRVVYPSHRINALLEREAKTKWGEEWTLEKMYPVLTHYYPIDPAMVIERMSSPVLSLLKEKSAYDIALRVFGKRKMRKDLVKAVAGANLEAVLLMEPFKNYVPIDWIINFLRRHPKDLIGSSSRSYTTHERNISRKMKEPLAVLQRKHLKHMLNVEYGTADELRRSWNFLHDTARIQRRQEANFDGVKSIADFHDAWFAYNLRRPARAFANGNAARWTPPVYENKQLTPDPLSAKIDGMVIDHMRVEIPTDSDTLREWGNFMHNCIGSYGHKTDKQTLGAVMVNDEVFANFEIQSGQLKQLLGKYNRNLPKGSRETLEAFFEAFGVRTDTYWGKAND